MKMWQRKNVLGMRTQNVNKHSTPQTIMKWQEETPEHPHLTEKSQDNNQNTHTHTLWYLHCYYQQSGWLRDDQTGWFECFKRRSKWFWNACICAWSRCLCVAIGMWHGGSCVVMPLNHIKETSTGEGGVGPWTGRQTVMETWLWWGSEAIYY